MNSHAPNNRKVREMTSEHRFDYKKAKPNRFVVKMNPNVAWMVERFVGEVKVEKPKAKAVAKKTSSKKKPVKKAKPAKTSSSKRKKKK